MQVPFEIILERDQLQQVIQVNSDVAIIGRGHDCDVCVNDPLASRHHCRIELVDNQVYLVDLDSRNGSWVGGNRIDRHMFVGSDILRIGSTTIKLHNGFEQRLDAIESTQIQQMSRHQQALRTMLSSVNSAQLEERIPQLAAIVVDAAVNLCRAERGFLFLLKGERIDYSIARNFANEVVSSPEEKFSRTIIERAIESKTPVAVEDAAADGKFSGVESISDLGLRSVVAVALRHRKQVLGVLAIDHRLTQGAFADFEIEMLQTLASLSALNFSALDQRKQLQQMRRRISQLQKESSKSGKVIAQSDKAGPYTGIVGISPVMKNLYSEMDKVLASELPVVIQGESGTGKELVARALHYYSDNSDAPFIAENCGAISESLLESELFGHVKGAFTGATSDRVGRFVDADGGTIFLDEIAEMSPAMQAKLLRVLQEGEIRPIGSDEVQKVKVRVISATHQDLKKMVQNGLFREDLFYRLNVVCLQVPPLRERQQDIPLLCEHLTQQLSDETGRPPRPISSEAMAILQSYSWPGNVRELRNEILRLLTFDQGEVSPQDLSNFVDKPAIDDTTGLSRKQTLPQKLEAVEIDAIRQMIAQEGGNRTAAAKALGISRFSLLRKIEKYGIDLPDENNG